MSDARSVFVDAKGVRLHARVEGPEKGPPVLVLWPFASRAL